MVPNTFCEACWGLLFCAPETCSACAPPAVKSESSNHISRKKRDHGRHECRSRGKNTLKPAPPWKSGPSGPRKPSPDHVEFVQLKTDSLRNLLTRTQKNVPMTV